MAPHANPQRCNRRAAKDTAHVNDPGTSKWVRRSTRANTGINYCQDPYAELMEDTPENSARSEDETGDTTEVSTKSSAEDSPDNSSDEDPVLLPGRTQKAVKRSDTDDSTDEDPIIPPNRTQKVATVAKQATGNDTDNSNDDSTDDSVGEGNASVPSPAHCSPEVPLMSMFCSAPLTLNFAESAMRSSLKSEKLHAPANGSEEPSSEASDPAADAVSSEVGSASSTEFSEDEDVVPSASNRFKFTTDSSTGRTAAELDSIFRPPPRMPRWHMDVDSRHAIDLSYTQLGPRPKEGLADRLVNQMETQHALDVQKAEEEEMEKQRVYDAEVAANQLSKTPVPEEDEEEEEEETGEPDTEDEEEDM
jgi:hypothetical protein